MEIDVLINSCARPKLLEISLFTFLKYVKTYNHEFRYVIFEDKVDDESRRIKGKKWIEDHDYLFDEVIFLKQKAGIDKFIQPIIKRCKSEVFIHIEDDNQFITDINIDSLIDFMMDNKNIVEIIFSRGKSKHDLSYITLDNIELTESGLFSVATGLFKTKQYVKIIDEIGWGNELHESALLTPVSTKLNLKRYKLGHNKQHYIHIGKDAKYRKGKYE